MENFLIKKFIQSALAEDIGKGDLTTLSTLPLNLNVDAYCIVKEDCVIAGIELADLICKEVDTEFVNTWDYKDGDTVIANTTIGIIKGKLHSVLKIERLVLNFMQRMSGIASKTATLVELISKYNVIILDTRKTTPNNRIFEKWAVKIGGGENHRFGLDDTILIKDNHIQAAGGIKNAIENCEKYKIENKIEVPIIVEIKNMQEFKIALSYPFIDRILIDNFMPNEIYQLVKINNNHKKLEVSGNINISNIIEYAQTGIDYISMGNLTHHISSIDISLKIK